MEYDIYDKKFQNELINNPEQALKVLQAQIAKNIEIKV